MQLMSSNSFQLVSVEDLMTITKPFLLFICMWQLTVKLVVKEWQFSDGSLSLNKFNVSSLKSMYGSSNLLSRTGRKINVAIMEGKDLISKERSGKCDPYVKLQYGKVGF